MVFEDIVLSSSGGAAGSTIPLFPTTTGNSLFPQSTVVLSYRLIVPKSSGLQAIHKMAEEQRGTTSKMKLLGV